MKNVIITGASGFLSSCLIDNLSCDMYQLFLLSSHPDIIRKRYDHMDNIKCFSYDSFLCFVKESHCHIKFDVLIHLAFSTSQTNPDYACAIDYSSDIIKLFKALDGNMFINISSQSVYGTRYKELVKEDCRLVPETKYAVAKHAVEVLVENAFEGTETQWTSIRLSNICENSGRIHEFVQNALCKIPMRVQNVNNMYQFLSAKDFAAALALVVLKSDLDMKHHVYNLGNNHVYSELEIAKCVQSVANIFFDIEANIEYDGEPLRQFKAMDSTLFYNDFSWEPQCVELVDMVKAAFCYEINKQ